MSIRGLRQLIGSAVFDLPRAVPRLLTRGGWPYVVNRGESWQRGDGLQGVRIAGGWSSSIHVCDVYPRMGQWLMCRALAQWPIAVESARRASLPPRVSFVIPYRGRDRAPLLRLVLDSVLAQRDIGVECIVVEQSETSVLAGLPDGVRHIHLPHPTDALTWRKSWALNVGVKAARTDIIVCHDADIVVPEKYAAEICRHFDQGSIDVAHLHRFLFCLTDEQTRSAIGERRVCPVPPECVRQHWQGGTVAIRREAFYQIGGFDEAFVGWTGEDREFYDRCLALRVVNAGYLPFVHLHHPPQQSKCGPERDQSLRYFGEVMRTPRDERIERLRQDA